MTSPMKGIPRHELEMAFDEYEEKTETVGALAKRLNVSPNKFIEMYHYHLESRETPKPLPARAQGFPILADKLKDIKVEKIQRKEKIRLTPEQRLQVVEAVNAGGSYVGVSKRFNVHESTVLNIMKEYRAKKAGAVEATLSVPPGTPLVAPVPELKIALENPELKMSFEGEYLVLKIPAKMITRTLLKDFI